MHVFDGKKLNFHFLNSLFSGIACGSEGHGCGRGTLIVCKFAHLPPSPQDPWVNLSWSCHWSQWFQRRGGGYRLGPFFFRTALHCQFSLHVGTEILDLQELQTSTVPGPKTTFKCSSEHLWTMTCWALACFCLALLIQETHGRKYFLHLYMA